MSKGDRGIDFGYGKIKGSVIRDAGYKFCMRYLSNSPGKNLTKAEYKDLKSANLDLGLVWETSIKRPLDGYEAGIQDAKEALRQAVAITGSPQTVYFAVDSDFPDDQLQVIGEYFEGVAEVLVKHQIGVYGSHKTVGYMLDNDLAMFAFQTYAWSAGKWDPRAHIRQTDIYPPKLAGVAIDINLAMTNHFGQF